MDSLARLALGKPVPCGVSDRLDASRGSCAPYLCIRKTFLRHIYMRSSLPACSWRWSVCAAPAFANGNRNFPPSQRCNCGFAAFALSRDRIAMLRPTDHRDGLLVRQQQQHHDREWYILSECPGDRRCWRTYPAQSNHGAIKEHRAWQTLPSPFNHRLASSSRRMRSIVKAIHTSGRIAGRAQSSIAAPAVGSATGTMSLDRIAFGERHGHANL